ncbi:hypothetical protein E2C04_15135 [Nocardioides daphniae]|nr:hypothetical protein E2C04_15135 [Nocardioides daphniae]
MGWVRVNVSDDVSSLESLKPWWIDPSWPFWYLLAMVVWRLATPVVRRSWLWLPGAVALSLVVGRWDLPWLDLNRVIGFLPFYVLGVHLPGWLTVLLKRRVSVPFALVAMAGLWWFSAHTDTWFPTEWLYYRTPYGHLDASTEQGMAIRALLLGLGLVGALSVLALLPRRKHAITAMGAWTMVVYLLHGFVMQGVIALDLVDLLPDHAWTQVLAVVAFAVALAFFLGWPPVARRLSWIVDPVDAVRSLRRRRG